MGENKGGVCILERVWPGSESMGSLAWQRNVWHEISDDDRKHPRHVDRLIRLRNNDRRRCGSTRSTGFELRFVEEPDPWDLKVKSAPKQRPEELVLPWKDQPSCAISISAQVRSTPSNAIIKH